MLHGFRYPLTPADLDAFTHPHPDSAFHTPFFHDGAVHAANHYLILRVHRGQWMDNEFPPASPAALSRLAAFRWETVPTFRPDQWFPLDGIETDIRHKFGRLDPWLGSRCNASPVWKLGDIPVRITFLHLAARLPRAECAWHRGTGPLWLRFSGGMGAIARDPRLDRWSREVWDDRLDPLTGETVRPTATPPPKPVFKSPAMANWPPPEPSDP